jgi:ABC-type branched-subunit amino acid transport system substrate-binding protein
MTTRRKRGVGLVLVATVVGLTAALLTPAVGGASAPKAVTIDKTINVGGIGLAKTYANDAPVGAQARLERANKDNEVKGYTFSYKGFADDNNDPNTALSESRRLVSQEGVVAIVPDVSIVPPTDYLTQSQIPSFGPGYSVSYCPTGAAATRWAFGIYGCLIPESPKQVPNSQWVQLKKALAAKGIKNPTAALIGTDSTSGTVSVAGSASGAQAAGFKVVYAKGSYPAPPTVVGDYTPYAQALMTSNNGNPPDVVYSSIPATNALQLFGLMKGQGYTGTVLSPFYSNLLLKSLQGDYVFVQFSGFESNTPAIQQMLSDVNSFKPGTPQTIGLVGGYYAADMFVQAVKAALKSNKTLTTASIQKVMQNYSYTVKGAIGPTNWPSAFSIGNGCSTLLYDADGTAFTISQPYTCNTNYAKVVPKYKGGYPK